MSNAPVVVLTGLAAITARGDVTLHGDTQLASPSDQFSIDGFALENYPVSPKTYLDRASALALAGGALALRDAGIEWPVTNDRFGITLGTHDGCIDTMHKFMEVVAEKGTRLANPLLFSHSYFNSPISLCAIEFGLKGYHSTFSAHENSGLEAVRAAHDAITLGHADAMLCGGVEALTATRQACEGNVPLGEASTFFVLESQEHAAQRGLENPSIFLLREPAEPMEAIRAQFGHCGGAASALALVQSFLVSSSPKL